MSASRFLNIRLAVVAAMLAAAGLLASGIWQETPVGSLRGTVIARENGNPLQAEIYLNSVDVPEGERLHYNTKSRENGEFSIKNVAAGVYKLDIRSKAHHMKPLRVVVAEGKTEFFEAALEPDAPYLDLYVHQNVFTPGEVPQVTCHGFLESDALNLRVYLVEPLAFLTRANASLSSLIGGSSWMSADERSKLNLDANQSLRLAHQEDIKLTRRDLEGIFTQRITLPALAPGLYVTAVRAAGQQNFGWVMVTSLGLIAKTSGSQTLAYAVDLKTGDPVPSAGVSLFLDSNQVAAAKTDAKGLARLSASAGVTGRPDQIILARSGDAFAFISADFSSNPSGDRTIYTYTERPVYRPAQTVFYKGIVRNNVNDTYQTPAGQPVVVEVRDPEETLIYRGAKTTNDFGCYSGSIPLNSEAPTGRYSIRNIVNGEEVRGGGAGFTVTAYRKPEFNVKVTFDRKRYTRGQWVKARISVNYYFGSPVANAELYYDVNRSAYWLFGADEYGEEGYSDYGGYGESVKWGEIRTDENGEATVEFPATWEQPRQDDGYDTDQQFTVSVNATDKSGTQADGEGSVLVTRGQFAVEVEPASYVTSPGERVDVLVKAQDFNRRPMRNQEVLVTLGRERWSDDGEYSLQRLVTRRVKTDENGRAGVNVPVRKPGSLIVTARAEDSRGNAILSSAYLWSTGDIEGGYQDPNMQGVDVVLDKRTYSAGDTAKALILTNRPGLTALVTVEGSRIYETRVVKLSGKSTLIEFPIKGSYKPNFYVSVCGVCKKRFLRKEVSAKVSIKSEELKISIQPDKRIYKPAQKASYRLQVTDALGQPVSAELALGVVDEAIYAIEPEGTTPILDYFYARRENSVRTYDSFPQIYLSDPDKAGSPLQTEPMRIRVRKRFLDTAYWGPSIITDARGQARVSFSLPDNLTTWRATVRGITKNTLCGQATNTVIARQPMLVRLELPRFLVQGDRSVLTAVVHNYTGSGQRVKVKLMAADLGANDPLERSVFVPNGDAERVDWLITAPRPGTFAVQVRAAGETAGDAVQLVLPVKPRGELLTSSLAGVSAAKSKTLSIPVRNDAVMEATRLKIRIAPSLASSILGSLDYLAQYPYGCTEQTVSAFLPDVILLQSMKTLGLSAPRLEAELPDMVSKGFARIYRFELPDGGWSWSQYGSADVWMTSYVCYALIRAKQAGLPVKEDVMERGLRWLGKQVTSNRKMYVYHRAFGLYVLSLAGQDVTGKLDAIFARQKLWNETLAVLALAYHNLGRQDRAEATLARLYGNGTVDGSGIHWQGARRYDGGPIEPTALALQATLRISPSDPRVYEIVRWLMNERKGDYWWSTRGTAMVLYGMSEFLQRTKELTPDENVSLILNGKSIGMVRFTSRSVYAPQKEFTIAAPDLRKGHNTLEILKHGSGAVYYSTNLAQYAGRKRMPPVVSPEGIKVRRAYYTLPRNYNPYKQDGLVSKAITGCGTGDTVLVRLTVYANGPFRHMMLEDNIPAGCEIITRGDVGFWDWNYWWGGQDARDDRISFYVDRLPQGKSVIDYRVRAGFGGRYTALPAQVFSMYDPSIRATTGETEFRIR